MLGAYMSPVNDAYAKPGLAPSQHRLRMAELAVVSSPLIMVDSWEARQPGYSRTLTVMQRLQHLLGEALSGSQPPPEKREAGAKSFYVGLLLKGVWMCHLRRARIILWSSIQDFCSSCRAMCKLLWPNITVRSPVCPWGYYGYLSLGSGALTSGFEVGESGLKPYL